MLLVHFHFKGILSRCVMSQIWFHTESNYDSYKRAAVVISEFCEDLSRTYRVHVYMFHTLGTYNMEKLHFCHRQQ